MLQRSSPKAPRSAATPFGRRPALMAAVFAVILTTGFAADEAFAKSSRAKYREDARTCESFGAKYGTPRFTDCMLEQQHRRDTKQLKKLEESQMLSQLAKDSQLMAERARKQRCDRDPNRRECRRK